MEKNEKFTIGADPEFGFVHANADDVLVGEGRCTGNDDDCDDDCEDCEWHSDNDLTEEDFGLDGAQDIAEIRPRASENPIEVANSIRSIMREGLKLYPDSKKYIWKAGSIVNGNPIGGHIHFGIGRAIDIMEYGRILDRSVSLVLLMLERKRDAIIRRGDYGTLNDCRYKDWGFEYRTPASWITDYRTAVGTLCLAHSVMHDALNDLSKTQEGHKTHVLDVMRPTQRLTVLAISSVAEGACCKNNPYQVLLSDGWWYCQNWLRHVE